MPLSPDIRTSYDEFPYPSQPFRDTHPDHLAVVATLLGLRSARADRCRVLELGCASGGNLIPLAYTYPDSTFLGIDLSVEQIRQGEELRAALGLTNVELRALNLLEVDDQFGTFDFIICHGVYSWVPAAVQDRILEICTRRLAPDGIGFVSYNTFPGWHMRGMIRAMMGLHDRRFRDRPAAERVAEARTLLAFLAAAVPQEDAPYSLLLRQHLDQLSACTDPYLFHEHLEECNEPAYFIEFCERLAAKGLRYLGESEFQVMVPSSSFSPEVQDRLQAAGPELAGDGAIHGLPAQPYVPPDSDRSRPAPTELRGPRGSAFRVPGRVHVAAEGGGAGPGVPLARGIHRRERHNPEDRDPAREGGVHRGSVRLAARRGL